MTICGIEQNVTFFGEWQQRVGSIQNWQWQGWNIRYACIQRSQGSPDSAPLMLLHGFGASIGHWRHNLAVLGEHHSVYALDMLGFGGSDKPPVNYSVSLWVEQVYDFWRSHINKPVVLVGNSIGSLVCLAAAAAHPEMVQGIVMISLPDPSSGEDKIPQLLRPAIASLCKLFTSAPILTALFHLVRRPTVLRSWAAMAYANPAAVTDELIDILSGPAQDRGSAQAFCAILKAMSSGQFFPGLKGILSSLKIPMLLLSGLQDRMVPPKFARQFITCNPNMQLVELDNAGHCPHDECPERVNTEILNWINTWCTNTLNSISAPSLVPLFEC